MMLSRIVLLVRVLVLGALGFGSVGVCAGQASVSNARIWDAPDHTRLVLELSQPVEYKSMMLGNPDRLVVDISNAVKKLRFDSLNLTKSPIKTIRSAPRDGYDLRVVFDLAKKISPKVFMLEANEQYGNRLVIDLYTDGKAAEVEVAKPVAPKSVDPSTHKRDIVIVIDPGHGGEDPGAIGPNQIKEKIVVLEIAKQLKSLIDNREGFKAYLTRSSDYYIGLRKRTKLARNYNADLMVSVHADAFQDAQANGASVYALSDHGATSEAARWLAQKENSADLIGGVGGVSLDDKNEVLAGVLLDLSTTASLKASLGVGDHVLRDLGGIARLHKNKVQQAGFVVLKSPDIPSILVETGFISNTAESKLLQSSKYQLQIAQSISQGLVRYFEQSPPPGSLVAWKKSASGLSAKASVPRNNSSKYVVQDGDTLSHIAKKNAVTVEALLQANNLDSHKVQVGQQLQVPSS